MKIRILPSMPEYRYIFTCRFCGSHVVSNYVLFDDERSPPGVICGSCERPYAFKSESRENCKHLLSLYSVEEKKACAMEHEGHE